MTLSQRLTRAGLTFILLGFVAAVLPQQEGAVIADATCNPGNGSGQTVLSFTNSSTPVASITPATDPYQLTTTAKSIYTYYKGPSDTNFTRVTPDSANLTVSTGAIVLSGAPFGPGGPYTMANATLSYSVRLTTGSQTPASSTTSNGNTGRFGTSYTTGGVTYKPSIALQGP